MGISQQVGASSLNKPGVCTSLTRPAAPYEGQMIYETDTDRVLVWNGTAWYANWNLPWGIVARSTGTGSSVSLTTTLSDIGTSVTFTAVANRYYKYTFYSYASNATAAGVATTYITDSANAIKGYLNLYVPGGAFYTYQHLMYVSTETAGSVTRKVRAAVQTGTGTLYDPLYLIVEDIGPA